MNTDYQTITPKVIENAFTYSEYRALIDRLLLEKKTTGTNHSEAYLDYTAMNNRRMDRWDKTTKIPSELEELVAQIQEKQVWLIITEGWCGDAAQNIPFIQKLADLSDFVEVRYILRDENIEIMDQYLTNGGRSIPKLIALNEDLSEEFFTWGPRPEFLQERLRQYKLDPQGVSSADFATGTHLWYAKDKNRSLAKEFQTLISTYLSK
ncbi:thioredoxin family protein [Algoriphagus namhaensis]|uniref:Thioredoxin family protein n=1 Tax=Algoriphagus namhaensis TaxID=915353 RepID=A0ABV8AUL4_9BACT